MSHARRAGDERREAAILRHILSAALWGPEHVEPALARCRTILEETSNRQVHANCLVRIGGLEGLAGDFDAAREAIARARAIMDDLGLRHLKAHSTDVAVLVEMLAQDYEAAAREARVAYTMLEQMGDHTYLAAEALLTARALEADGRLDEAEEWLLIVNEVGDPSDSDTLVLQAQIMAHRGLLDEAEKLARTALKQAGEGAARSLVRRSVLHTRRDSRPRRPDRGGAAVCRAISPALSGEGHRPAREQGEDLSRRDPEILRTRLGEQAATQSELARSPRSSGRAPHSRRRRYRVIGATTGQTSTRAHGRSSNAGEVDATVAGDPKRTAWVGLSAARPWISSPAAEGARNPPITCPFSSVLMDASRRWQGSPVACGGGPCRQSRVYRSPGDRST